MLLWHAGYLRPDYNWAATFLVMVSPMVITAVFGARKTPEVLPRLIVFPLVFAGIMWLLAPTPSMETQVLCSLYVNEVYPFHIVPAAVFGGVVAVLSIKLRKTVKTDCR